MSVRKLAILRRSSDQLLNSLLAQTTKISVRYDVDVATRRADIVLPLHSAAASSWRYSVLFLYIFVILTL